MIAMYDSIDVSQMPAGAAAYAGYTSGNWPTFALLLQRFPHAHLLDIAVNASHDATCLDVEPGDATNSQVYAWFKRQQARKVWRPVLYTSVSNINPLVNTMVANGFIRSQYRIWSAHYGAGEHICGPATCKLTGYTCDGTQWTDHALGRNLDESVLLDSFFGTPPPAPATSTEDPMTAVAYWHDPKTGKDLRYEFMVGTNHQVYEKKPGSGWVSLGGNLASISAAISAAGEITVAGKGTDGAYWTKVQAAGGHWGAWASQGGQIA